MEPTFYTPEIDEFKFGFTFDIASGQFEGSQVPDKVWETVTLGYPFRSDRESIEEFLKRGIIRVKHLDLTDIEACGWNYYRGSYRSTNFKIKTDLNWKFRKLDNLNTTIIKYANKGVFQGTILNKSELLFQMKRLGIKTEKV